MKKNLETNDDKKWQKLLEEDLTNSVLSHLPSLSFDSFIKFCVKFILFIHLIWIVLEKLCA